MQSTFMMITELQTILLCISATNHILYLFHNKWGSAPNNKFNSFHRKFKSQSTITFSKYSLKLMAKYFFKYFFFIHRSISSIILLIVINTRFIQTFVSIIDIDKSTTITLRFKLTIKFYTL